MQTKAYSQALLFLAKTIGISIISGGIGKKILSEKDIILNKNIAYLCSARLNVVLYNFLIICFYYQPFCFVARKCIYFLILLNIIISNKAGVAELVDALDSKSGSLMGVGVRFPSPAPIYFI